MSETLFDQWQRGERASAPLAVRMRPRSVDDVIGQPEALAPGTPLERLLTPDGDSVGRVSVILWGPPGSGKTTIANLLASRPGHRYVELSAISAGVKEVRAAVSNARDNLAGGVQTVLFIDEVHRFSRTQQDALLPAVENGWVTLVAATTENPAFSVVGPLLSRSVVVRLRALTDEDIGEVVRRALAAERGLAGEFLLEPGGEQALLQVAGGDARRALTALEAAAGVASARSADGPADIDSAARPTSITASDISVAVQERVVDLSRDTHYDLASAFIKSIRGSDVDAALHYLARLLVAGEDPRFVARRLVILASEDVGMADPTALVVATAAMTASANIGMPEARIPLAQATVHLALAPKSNAAYLGINAAMADVAAGATPPVPTHLRDASYQGATQFGHGVGYVYPHDHPTGVVEQQYLPTELSGRRYYEPTRRGAEAGLSDRLAALRAAVSPEESQ